MKHNLSLAQPYHKIKDPQIAFLRQTHTPLYPLFLEGNPKDWNSWTPS